MVPTSALALLALLLYPISTLYGGPAPQPPSSTVDNHVITVSGEGEVLAKPDVGILVMALQSTAPIAQEALEANARKAKAVESAVASMQLSPRAYKITSATLGQAGGAYGMVLYGATQSVYVFFDSSDLSDATKLTEKTAAVVEGLRKAGAVPGNVAGAGLGGLLIYAVRDSGGYQKQALQKAIANAHDAAQDVAKGLAVKITGLRNVSTDYSFGISEMGNIKLGGLSFSLYSTKNDEISVRATVNAEYDFK